MRSHDLYCHAGRKRWPIEVDLAALRYDLSLLESIQADIPSSPVYALPIHLGPSGQRLVGLRRLGSLLQRIVLG